MELDVSQQPQDRQQALSDIRAILDAQRFGVLSTHGGGQPYASLVALAATDDLGRILFCTPRATRKYANLSRDPRAAILVHTSQNAAADCTEAMSLTATGTVVELRDGARDTGEALFLARHGGLADFVGDPQAALMTMEVCEFHLVRRFQDVVRLRMALRSAPSSDGQQADALRPGAAVILLAHGSRDEAWRTSFEQTAASLAESLGPGRVRPAYLQFAGPTLLESVTSAAEEGFRQIAVLPLFIAAGGHALRDVPEQVSSVREHWDDLQISILPRVGEARGFAELVEQLVRQAIGSSGIPRS